MKFFEVKDTSNTLISVNPECIHTMKPIVNSSGDTMTDVMIYDKDKEVHQHTIRTFESINVLKRRLLEF